MILNYANTVVCTKAKPHSECLCCGNKEKVLEFSSEVETFNVTSTESLIVCVECLRKEAETR